MTTFREHINLSAASTFAQVTEAWKTNTLLQLFWTSLLYWVFDVAIPVFVQLCIYIWLTFLVVVTAGYLIYLTIVCVMFGIPRVHKIKDL